MQQQLNVLGTDLQPCTTNTGYDRTGYCYFHADDPGTHIVCARVTREFLDFTKTKGNDLITPRGSFRGLIPGDLWCLCISRWLEAYQAGKAPPVYLRRTHQSALQQVPLIVLQQYALDI